MEIPSQDHCALISGAFSKGKEIKGNQIGSHSAFGTLVLMQRKTCHTETAFNFPNSNDKILPSAD